MLFQFIYKNDYGLLSDTRVSRCINKLKNITGTFTFYNYGF